jgi:phosphoglycerate dehydrogenase-like enzyme
MATPGPLVIQTEDLDHDAAAWLAERATLVRIEHGSPALVERLPHAAALVVRTYTTIDATFLDRAPNLRVIGRAGVGLDTIDLDACRARRVRVVHTPDANTQAVAEYVLALMFDALRPRLFLDRPAASLPAWQALRRELTAPRQLSELTLGIVGLGRIGSRVARLANALGMRTIYNDIQNRGDDLAAPVTLAELCAHADAVTIHVDGRRANRGLIGPAAFAAMRSDALVINTSRGIVLDEAACAEFLRRSPAATAILDVQDPEPLTDACPLLGLPNAHLSPHIAGATAAAKRAMSWVVRDVWRVLSGLEPHHEAT